MASPVLAFIIGLAIILVASILNAAGLNLTKLDHACCFFYLSLSLSYRLQVRSSAVPKSDRKKDYMRPLWLLGMLLYMQAFILFH